MVGWRVFRRDCWWARWERRGLRDVDVDVEGREVGGALRMGMVSGMVGITFTTLNAVSKGLVLLGV